MKKEVMKAENRVKNVRKYMKEEGEKRTDTPEKRFKGNIKKDGKRKEENGRRKTKQ
jgi:hypothetical protein